MIIHAVNIHIGGGKVLLDQIITEPVFGDIQFLICDSRYILPDKVNASIKIFRIQPSLLSRWKAEFLLRNISNSNPLLSVLCFSNLPPAFKLKNKVILYLQNALLLPGVPLYAIDLKTSLRLCYEKIWLNLFIKNTNEIWVQTKSMKTALSNINRPVLIKPIYPKLSESKFIKDKKYDFITITGSAPHKRLKELLQAWKLFPATAPSLLVVTDSLSEDISNLLADLKSKNVKVLTNISREEIFQHYSQSRCLLVTSKLESFCLPLYEARHFNLKILGPDEPYVKDFGEVDGILDMKNKDTLKNSVENNLVNIK